MKIGMTARQNSAAVTDVIFHSTHRKGYQSKFLFFHSKGGRCSFWGLLFCDDRRSPWWASRNGLQHDHIRSDTVMIREILTVMPVSECQFCFSFVGFRICSRFNNVNYGAWYVYKPLFGSSVATCQLAYSEMSISIIGKKLKRSPGKSRT